jgi:hypothetical protein
MLSTFLGFWRIKIQEYLCGTKPTVSIHQASPISSLATLHPVTTLGGIVNCLPQRTTGNVFTETKIIHIFVYFLRQCNYTYYSTLKKLTTDTNRSEYYATSQRQEIFTAMGMSLLVFLGWIAI